MTKTNILLFSYGIELSLPLLHSTLGGPPVSCLGQAYLPNFSFNWAHSSGLPTLKSKRSSKTIGAITSLSVQQFQRLILIRSGIYVAKSCIVYPVSNKPLSFSKNSPLSFLQRPLSFSKLTSPILRSPIVCQCLFPAITTPSTSIPGTPHPWAWRETIAGAHSRQLPDQWIQRLEAITPVYSQKSYSYSYSNS